MKWAQVITTHFLISILAESWSNCSIAGLFSTLGNYWKISKMPKHWLRLNMQTKNAINNGNWINLEPHITVTNDRRKMWKYWRIKRISRILISMQKIDGKINSNVYGHSKWLRIRNFYLELINFHLDVKERERGREKGFFSLKLFI